MLTPHDTDLLKKLEESHVDNNIIIHKLLDSHHLLLSQICHELRNPLTMLSCSLQLIESQHPEVIHYAHWSNLSTDIAFMEKLLQDFSFYNHGNQIKQTTIHTSAFLQQTVASFSSIYSNSSFTFTYDIPDYLPNIKGDPTKLQQLLFNLFRNAVEATSYKGIISFTTIQKESQIILTVQDNGCGIPSSQIDDIFTPFTTFKKNGTGLGLAIVKAVTEAHHGTISVESELSKGTTFTLTLPVENRCH